METNQNKHVEVKFVADQDIGKEIISIKDRKNKKHGNALQGRKRRKFQKSSDSEEEVDDLSNNDIKANEKPTGLFETGDIPGQQMFGFQTPKGKGTFAPGTPHSRKMNGTPHGLNGTPSGLNGTSRGLNGTPRGLNGTPKASKGTPRTSNHKVAPPKTPYSLRRRLKKKIASTVCRDANGGFSDSDFSASESEYNPSGSETSSSSEAEAESDEKDDDSVKSVQAVEQKIRPRRERKLQDMEYILEADEFFTNQKSVTSDHTLNRLQQPRLAEEQLQQLLGNMTLSHQQAVYSLCAEHTQYFTKWMFALREQYSVVLYGLGSKRHTLQQFRKKMLDNQLVLEVNGFFPSLTIKEIVDCIADDLLELSDRPAGLLECLEAIEAELSNELFIIVHNLDGPMLQSDKSQDILSRLARMQHVHLVASIDHINAPLIWDQAKLSRYNFMWWDVTSLQPYSGETQFESSLLVQRSGGLALSSLSNVFNSLTTNARSIFILMVSHQMSHHKDPTYSGMPFKDLYWKAREALLVSSDLALRAQLTEFLDHRLVRQRRSHDGSELLVVPVDNTVLQRFLEKVEGDT